MPETLFFTAAEFHGAAREEVLKGDGYLVRSLKIVKPMVLNGHTNGPAGGQLLPENELKRCPVDAWSNIPFTLGHPFVVNTDGSKSLKPANSPAMVDQFQIGSIFNTDYDAEGRLAGEAWLNLDACQLFGGNAQRVIDVFRSGDAAEVSSAYHFTLDPTRGQHNGISYNAIQRDIRPDHVAILLDSRGACANDDGCGFGVNCANCGDMTAINSESFWRRMMPAFFQRIAGNATFGDLNMSLHDAISQRFAHEAFLVDVEDKPRRAIIRHNGRTVALPFAVDASGRVTLDEGEPQVVQQSTSFITANKEGGSVEKIMTREQLLASPDVDDTVKKVVQDALAFQEAETTRQEAAREEKCVRLAANEAVSFSLEELRSLSDPMLDKVEEMATEAAKPAPTNYGLNGQPAGALQPAKKQAANEGTQDGADMTFVRTPSTIPAKK